MTGTISSAKPRADTSISPIVARFELFELSKRSFMERLNRSGPNLLPCKTPRLMWNSGDRKPSTRTFAGFEENKFLITRNNFSLVPALIFFGKSKWRGAVSKAVFRS